MLCGHVSMVLTAKLGYLWYHASCNLLCDVTRHALLPVCMDTQAHKGVTRVLVLCIVILAKLCAGAQNRVGAIFFAMNLFAYMSVSALDLVQPERQVRGCMCGWSKLGACPGLKQQRMHLSECPAHLWPRAVTRICFASSFVVGVLQGCYCG